MTSSSFKTSGIWDNHHRADELGSGMRNMMKYGKAYGMELIKMTIPDKPRSSKQKYRLTGKGKRLLKSMKE